MNIDAYRFFKQNAGYVVGRCAEGALALARAEALAEAQPDRIRFRWEPDQVPDRGPEDWGWPENEVRRFWRTEHDVWGCVLEIDGEPSGSLWGIWDPDADYRRVIEAGLLLEAIYEDNPLYLPLTAGGVR